MSHEQDTVTREWDGLAGEWDDLACVYARSLFAHVTSCGWFVDVATNPAVTTVPPPQPQALRMVDFGCGTGLWIEQMMRQSHSGQQDHAGAGPNCHWHILALDASGSMIRVLREKIRNCEWSNVQTLTTVLAQWDNDSQETTSSNTAMSFDNSSMILSEWWGTADIVVAWNVLSFIPQSDQAATMRQIARLLKPSGIICHSDWPDTFTTDDRTAASTLPIGNDVCTMNAERALQLYTDGGLHAVSMELVPLVVSPRSGDRTVPVFVGVARKALAA
jgi:SAM-dependent methyltransferase